MREWQSQSHVKWYCRYHVVFVPKYPRRSIYGSLRRQIGGILRELCQQHRVELAEGHAMPDHIHLCLSIPPKYSVANTVGFLKGDHVFHAPDKFGVGIGRDAPFPVETRPSNPIHSSVVRATRYFSIGGLLFLKHALGPDVQKQYPTPLVNRRLTDH